MPLIPRISAGRMFRFGPSRPVWWELLAVFALGLFAFMPALFHVKLFHDEVHGIRTSDSFEAYIEGRWKHRNFRPGYAAITQAPMLRYMAGFGRCALHVENEPLRDYLLHESYEKNLRRGAIPSDKLLWACRSPFAVMAAAAGVLLFTFVVMSFGHSTGWFFITIYLTSDYFSRILVLIMGETPLLFFVTAAAIVCITVVSRSGNLWFKGGPFFRACAACGVLIGLALCSKINSVMAIPGSFLCLAAAGFRGKVKGPQWLKLLFGGLIIAVTSGATFTMTHPYLIPNPVMRFKSMVDHRFSRLEHQPADWASDYLNTPVRRLDFLERPYVEHLPFTFPGIFYGALALSILGAYRVIRMASHWMLGAEEGVGGVVALFWGLALAVPMLTTPMAWERYLLFPTVVVDGTIAVALGHLVSVVWNRWRGSIDMEETGPSVVGGQHAG